MTVRALMALTILLTACSGGSEPSSTSVSAPATDTYTAAFESWLGALQSAEYQTAASITEPSQVPLLALAEGLSGPQVAGLTDADREAVAANFWSGFVGQLEAATSLSTFRIDGWTEDTAGGRSFAVGELFRSSDASVREVVLVETAGGWAVDLIATFPAALVNLVPDAAQVIRATGDQRLVEELRLWQSSVELVISRSESDPLLSQAGLAALESIVR